MVNLAQRAVEYYQYQSEISRFIFDIADKSIFSFNNVKKVTIYRTFLIKLIITRMTQQITKPITYLIISDEFRQNCRCS